MADIHIEDFYRDTALILVNLYNAFPRRINLFVEDISGPDEPDEFGLHSKRHAACFGAMLWLAEEGMLRYVDTIRQEALDQAVLTQAAFVRLSAPADTRLVPVEPPPAGIPEPVLADLATHIHLLRQTLRTGTSSQLSRVVQATLFPGSLLPALH
ncbi:MAG: hypothetical protein LAT63_03760 [Marinobacter sp.]|nr:hypothetical protein [Marinobacter sp.]